MAKPAKTEHFVASPMGIALYADSDAEKAEQSTTPTMPSEIQILTADDYASRELNITEKHLHQMAANHRASGVDPAVDREHESWKSRDLAQPAQGWVKSLRVGPTSEGKPALFGTIDWTDLGKNAVANRHFRYVSAGFTLAAQDRRTKAPIGAFLDHVALVKHPFVQGMTPLSFSYDPVADKVKEENNMEFTQAKKLLGLSADADETALVSAIAERNQELSAAKEVNVALSKQLADANEAVAGMRKASIKAEVANAVKAFRISEAEASDFEALAEANPGLFASMLPKREAKQPGGETIVVKDMPRGEQSAEVKLLAQEKLIAAHQLANPTLSYTDAFVECARTNPEVFNEEGV